MLKYFRKRRSFIFNIYLCFLIIILLLASFHLFSFQLFNKSLQNEVIQNNQMLLRNTAERYQTHFERVKSMLFDLYYNEYVVAFNKQTLTKDKENLEYYSVIKLLKELRTHAYNPMLYLENLAVYYKSDSVIVEKEGSLDAQLMFSHFFVNDDYPLAFWEELSTAGAGYKLHKERSFRIAGLNENKEMSLIPLSFHTPSSNYQTIAFLDATKLKEMYFNKEDDRQFIIMNEDGTILYRSSDTISVEDIPLLPADEGYRLVGDQYFFKERDTMNNLTFITVVSYSHMTAGARTASITMFIMVAASVLLGLMISIFFSRKLHRPLHQIMNSIMQQKPILQQSDIHELDLIHRNLHELIKEKDNINKELAEKQSLLTHYGYINKLKAITSDIHEWRDIALMNEAFYIVLFHLHLRNTPETAQMNQGQPHKIAYYLKKYIDVTISEHLQGTHTLQIENNQILSIVQAADWTDELDEAMSKIKRIVDRDNEHYIVAVSISSVYRGSSEFNKAYEEVLQLVRSAKPIDECQIIREAAASAHPFILSLQQEQELYANLQAGNTSFCISFLNQALEQCRGSLTTVAQLQQLAESILNGVAKILEAYGSDEITAFRNMQTDQIRECWTIEQFSHYFCQLFRISTSIIQAKKEDQPSTISIIMNHIEQRFAEDLSLDELADMMQLSPAYLSVYIKEKTGTNFSEHLNAIRIRKAKQLLSDTALNIQDISLQIGYRNVTSFIRMFKKITGVPPGEYRKQLQWENTDYFGTSYS